MPLFYYDNFMTTFIMIIKNSKSRQKSSSKNGDYVTSFRNILGLNKIK